MDVASLYVATFFPSINFNFTSMRYFCLLCLFQKIVSLEFIKYHRLFQTEYFRIMTEEKSFNSSLVSPQKHSPCTVRYASTANYWLTHGSGRSTKIDDYTSSKKTFILIIISVNRCFTFDNSVQKRFFFLFICTKLMINCLRWN